MKIDDIALTFVAGLGTKGIAHLLSIFGSAEAVFRASESELRSRAQLRGGVAEEILSRRCFAAAEREMSHAEHYNIIPVASTDKEYPPLLAECPDFPHVIYVQGNLDVLQKRAVAMVGTRNMSAYGQRTGAKIVEQIARAAPDTVIVSGLALGNDGNAHRAALHAGLPTVAVIANALPDVAPAEHRTLADQILLSGGAIITEINAQMKNKGDFFPSRNRIIAGMSRGTVVVESPYEGGSLLTADYAFDYGRAVMAVPGRADDKNSYGSNLLIKHNKAALVCSGGDVVHELGWESVDEGKAVVEAAETVNVSPDERRLLNAIAAGETVDYDVLAERSGFSAGTVAALLVSLELCGLVRRLPGKICERV